MSTVHGGQGNIITNGLLLNLDAANPRSYAPPYNDTTWTDLSGNGNSGTLTNGPTYNASGSGNILLDGTDDYIIRNSSINTGQNFTVDIWFKTTNTGRRGLVSNSYPYSANSGWYFFIGGFGSSNGLSLSIGNDQAHNTTGANVIASNQWYNAHGVVANGGSIIQIYLNGVLQSTTGTLTTVNIVYTTANYKIGALLFGGVFNDYFGGNIGSVKIYNRALSASEILQNFNATRARFGI